jgi:hypothetical protein
MSKTATLDDRFQILRCLLDSDDISTGEDCRFGYLNFRTCSARAMPLTLSLIFPNLQRMNNLIILSNSTAFYQPFLPCCLARDVRMTAELLGNGVSCGTR